MSTENTQTTGEQLDRDIESIQNRIDRIEGDLEGFGRGDIDPKYVKEVVEPDLKDIRREIEELSISNAELHNSLDAIENTVTKLKQETETGTGTAPAQDDAAHYRVIGDPDHTKIIDTGPHQDDSYHEHGSWGMIVSTEQRVSWREAAVYAQHDGKTRIEIYPIDTDYNLGDVYRTREVKLNGGYQPINPDLVLQKGRWFITRDTHRDDPVPLKRTMSPVSWKALNEQLTDVPFTFERSWQIGREPGTEAFSDYEDQRWHRILHNYADIEIGYNSPTGGD